MPPAGAAKHKGEVHRGVALNSMLTLLRKGHFLLQLLLVPVRGCDELPTGNAKETGSQPAVTAHKTLIITARKKERKMLLFDLNLPISL